MAEGISSKNRTNNSDATLDAGGFARLVSLINPNETLVKKEDRSVVVRNKDGKLVRRTSASGGLDSIYNLIAEGEIFVREEASRLVVRNKDGKLVARKKPEQVQKTQVPIKPQVKESIKSEEPPKPQKPPVKKEETPAEETPKDNSGLKSRLMSKHAFLSRIERGEKIGSAFSSGKPMESVNDDLVEEIDVDDDDDEEEISPDAEVLELEDAVTEDKYNRTVGNSSSKGRRAGETGTFISGGAKNPNEKPSLKGTATGNGLVGNYSLATPEKLTPEEEPKKKEKKKRKPIKPWIIAVVCAGIYAIGMLTYFLVGFNFGKKQVGITLYYIDISEDAKLEYYDGEQFVFGGMKMTYYYDDEHIETKNIDGRNFADTTVGMGYSLSGSSVNALWVDSFALSSSRNVKVKFVIDDLICYVPITIHRNRLNSIEKYFDISSISAGQELSPTIFGVYSNYILDKKGESIKKEIPTSGYDLKLYYAGQTYSLKDLGCFDGNKFVLPEKIGDVEVDYTDATIDIFAVVESDGYNAQKQLKIYG